MADKKFNLWVILGLKDANYKSGFVGAKKETASFSNVVKGSVNGAKEAFKNLGGISNTLKLGLVAGGAMMVANEFRKAIQYSIGFEKTLSNLKSLTGASSSDMKYYKEAANQLGSQFGKTGQEMAETFKIVGSGKSELLKNKEGLVAVSSAAITLSKAAGMEVPEAADALVVAMNQFNAPATQANRYINALAAGAKEGAAEIPNLSNSLTKFGSVANALKIPVEQSIAMIEALSEKGLKDEVAGTGIKTFLLKLEQGAKNTRPSVVGLEQALENLKKKNLSVNQAQEIFGMEAANVAIALISQTDRVKELNKAVTGTDEAYKQAGINSDNVAGALTSLSAAWTNAKESFLNGKGALTSFLKDLVLSLKQAVSGFELLTKSRSQKMDDKYTRANKVDTDSYSNQLGADNNLNNVKQDTYEFNRNKAEWQKRLAEAKKRGDTEEIQLAESKISLYNQLLSIARETIKVRTNSKDKVKASADGGKEKATPQETYRAALKENKEQYAHFKINEEEYTAARIKNLDDYTNALIKNNQANTKEFEKAYDEWSKLSSSDLINKDFGETAIEVSPKLDVKDLNNELDLGDEGALPIPVELKTDKEKFDIELDKIQSRLHPLELEVAISNTESVLSAGNAIGTISNAFDELGAKMKDGSAGFMDYFNAISSVAGGLINLYSAITQIIANTTALAAVNAATATAQKVVDTSKVMGQAATGSAAAITSALIGLPFPFNLAAAPGAGAAALAMYTPAISMLAFADGGVVPGNSFRGDGIVARVNSGEMILNGGQQAKLFGMLNAGGGSSNAGGGTVEFEIKGEKLLGVLKNTQNRKKTIGGRR